MATYIIPTTTANQHYRQTVDLDGTDYVMDFFFNSRDGFWYLDLLDTEGTRLRSGLKLATGVPLTRTWVDQGRPLGEIVIIDPEGAGTEPGETSIGETVFPMYIDLASLVESVS